MRVCAAFSRLLRLDGVWVRSVSFTPGGVIVTVALRRRRLVCAHCAFSARVRENVQAHESVWRHLDLGVWRLEIRATLRKVRCPVHGVHVEGVPFARGGARFTRDFEDLVAWLATKTDKTATCRLTRIDWQTIGRIIERVSDELLCEDRLDDLFEISIDEVAWRKGHRYLTLIADHRRRCVVWGTEGKGQAAADEFFADLDPVTRRDADDGRDAQATEIQVKPPADADAEDQVGERAGQLRAVSMDMTGGYAKSVRRHAPQAVICIDNYHVVALATKGAGRGPPRTLERAARSRRPLRRQAVQRQPLVAAEEPRRPHRPPGRHARRAAWRRRQDPACLGDEGDGPRDLRARPDRRRRR
jgi:transposase